jgi:hypothetical protein
VDEVYKFRDCYFETHSESEAGKKQGEVAQRMRQALKTLEEKEGNAASATPSNTPLTTWII